MSKFFAIFIPIFTIIITTIFIVVFQNKKEDYSDNMLKYIIVIIFGLIIFSIFLLVRIL